MSSFDALIKMLEARMKRQKEMLLQSQEEYAAAVAAKNIELERSAQMTIPGTEKKR